MIKSIQNSLRQLLPENVTAKSGHTDTKLSNKFVRTKHRTLNEHWHNIVCHVECSENSCSIEHVADHKGGDTSPIYFNKQLEKSIGHYHRRI